MLTTPEDVLWFWMRPFQGAVHVHPRGFELARDTLATA
jgi:hypothetical protein